MNILAIGAHFDDVELGCGGALARHVDEGDSVFAYVATVSGYTNINNQIVRTKEDASLEGKQAMQILGVNLIAGNFSTLGVEFNEEINSEILRIVENEKIDLVYAPWVGDIHHDHQTVARAALHSCRHVPRFLMYRSNWYHSPNYFHENYYVDITSYIELKEQAIRAYTSKITRTGGSWIEFFRKEAENAGQRIGVKYAEVYEVVKWLR